MDHQQKYELGFINAEIMRLTPFSTLLGHWISTVAVRRRAKLVGTRLDAVMVVGIQRTAGTTAVRA